MAITRIKLNTYSDLTALQESLNTYAVPKYFDKVVANADGSRLLCYVGDKVFLNIAKKMSHGISIVTSTGSTVTYCSNTTTGGTYCWGYMYICEHAIAITMADSSGNEILGDRLHLICKDAAGKTMFVMNSTSVSEVPGTVWNAGTATGTVYAVSVDDDAITSYTVTINARDQVTGMYALAPIPTQTSYAANVWFPFWRQHNGSSTPVLAEIEGKKYMAGRAFVALDE